LDHNKLRTLPMSICQVKSRQECRDMHLRGARAQRCLAAPCMNDWPPNRRWSCVCNSWHHWRNFGCMTTSWKPYRRWWASSSCSALSRSRSVSVSLVHVDRCAVLLQTHLFALLHHAALNTACPELTGRTPIVLYFGGSIISSAHCQRATAESAGVSR